MSVLAANIRAEIRRTAVEQPDLRIYGYKSSEFPGADTDKISERNDAFVVQVLRAVEWLTHVRKTARVNRGRSSFGYKGDAERWHGASGDGWDYYISNGAFIVAAWICGFEVERCKPDSLDACFNMGEHIPPSKPAHVTPPTRAYALRVPLAPAGS